MDENLGGDPSGPNRVNPSCTKGGLGWPPQRFFEDNSAQNEPKLAIFLLIQVR